MAKIYLAYNNRDIELVNQYKELLAAAGHEILTMGPNPAKGIIEGVQQADAILAFWTEAAVPESDVQRELEIASKYVSSKKPLLLYFQEGVAIPEYLSSIAILIFPHLEASDNVGQINDIINKNNQTFDTANGMTPYSFTQQLHSFLTNLPKDTEIGFWKYEGHTDIAYGTPEGPWETDGFLFTCDEYGFIVRSVAESAYLAVESQNLQGQLADVGLLLPKKFENNEGYITLRETYKMTVGLGAKTMKAVREAFESVGMSDDVITRFKENEIDWNTVVFDILRWSIFREEAKKKLQNRISIQHWFLKIYGEHWKISTLKEGDEGYFNSYYNSKQPRQDYAQYAYIREGDKGVAYDYSPQGFAAVFLFTVIKPLHLNSNNEEIFKFRIDSIFTEAVPLSAFQALLSFTRELNAVSLYKLFSISAFVYLYIKHLGTPAPQSLTDDDYIPTYSADNAKELKDELGFEYDVAALASVMAYKEMQPPLAVGLFGNWGTGKSFFMNKLKEQVTALEKHPSGMFCGRVLQIEFNSWHYSDSNLWASLVTKIFDELQKHGKKYPTELNKLLANLNSTKEQLQETTDKNLHIEREIEILKEKKRIFDEQVEIEVQELSPLSFKEILNGVLKDEKVQQDINNIKAFGKEYGIDIHQQKDIEANISKLYGFGDRIIESAKLIWHFRKLRVALLLLSVLAFAALVYFVLPDLAGLNQFLTAASKAILSLLAIISAAAVALKPAMHRLSGILERLKSLKKTVNELQEDARSKFEEKKKAHEDKLEEAKAKSESLKIKIGLLEIDKQKIEKSLDDIATGKTIIRFIESRVSEARYVNSLGIISWVRKDFEQLNQHFLDQKELQTLDQKAKEFHLDRIILYIDDLDRCNESIVLRVLEAIHLLLAFPLFVVVVGVDPRWVNRALMKKYEHFLDNGNNTEGEHMHPPATSYDYLEKIFQIPFALKPINHQGKANIIRAQLGLKIQPASPQASAAATPENRPQDDTQPTPLDGQVPLSGAVPLGGTQVPIPTAAPAQKKVDIKTLQVEPYEMEFMEEISFLIGDSPRTVKRFINMYRIIRTHKTFNQRVAKTHNTEEHYAIILLLAFITGLPKLALEIFEAISQQEGEQKFTSFISSYLKQKNSNDLLNILHKKDDEPYRLQQKLEKIKMEHLQKHLQLVSRFSFREMK